jgi:hypothetical protein
VLEPLLRILQDNFQRLLEFVVKHSQRNTPNAVQKRNTRADEGFAHDFAKPALAWLKFDDVKPPGSRSTQTLRSREDKARETKCNVGTHDNVTQVPATTSSTTPAPATSNLTTKNVKTRSHSTSYVTSKVGKLESLFNERS